ncbi:MAG: indole-3-glycerol phosphate synthase TrpC [Oscillospiraceae bacterium]|nr:indole-3-glycerol phosphate synthase TrpC [Oscillospiraceae bacterium]
MTILDEIATKTKIRVEARKAAVPLKELENKLRIRRGFAFENALKADGLSFICEVKKASPSKGIIAEDFPYIKIAREYEEAGAAAISVLTEPEYFLGSDVYLAEISKISGIPVLRKDFTVDEYQIYEAASLGASAVLLIAALLDTDRLKNYIKIADALGLSSLVETRDEAEIHSALKADARIIGVNNRNLKTFEVDIRLTARLRAFVPDNIIFVAESGIQDYEDIKLLGKVDAVLIGETLMRSSDKKTELIKLKGSA